MSNSAYQIFKIVLPLIHERSRYRILPEIVVQGIKNAADNFVSSLFAMGKQFVINFI